METINTTVSTLNEWVELVGDAKSGIASASSSFWYCQSTTAPAKTFRGHPCNTRDICGFRLFTDEKLYVKVTTNTVFAITED